MRIVNPIQARSQPPVRPTSLRPAVELRGQTLACIYLSDWRNFEVFVDHLELRLRERCAVAGVRRLTGSLRQDRLPAAEIARTVSGTAAAVVGLGA
ncbi:MAG: hypothetical protein HY329_12980 [Chloroflexi bacterium]|nr:hypothetical protein [Chloroflexota bacterium]